MNGRFWMVRAHVSASERGGNDVRVAIVWWVVLLGDFLWYFQTVNVCNHLVPNQCLVSAGLVGQMSAINIGAAFCRYQIGVGIDSRKISGTYWLSQPEKALNIFIWGASAKCCGWWPKLLIATSPVGEKLLLWYRQCGSLLVSCQLLVSWWGEAKLGGGYQDLFWIFKWSNLTCAYFSNGLVQPPTSIFV